ncbi:glycosyltransferase family 4 protein [Marinicrinis lubricantis]|uniref:Glycosyltransferase family 4 protein n=1 Tax=Marinicrinis lubricantis TaxID=2086470 RepID=A0ABW1IKJ8_9BACL
MKIYINGRFLTQKITGVQRYAFQLVRSIDNWLEQNGSGLTVTILVPGKSDLMIDIKLKNILLKRIGRLKGHSWEQLELPFFSRGGFLVNLCNTGPMYKRMQQVTIHDAAVFANPKAFSRTFRSWYRYLLKRLTKSTSFITTVSNFSRDEISKYCDVTPCKISVVYPGKEQLEGELQPDNLFLKEQGLDQKKYILAVSSLNPNKNFNSILKAVDLMTKEYDVSIVVAGAINRRVSGNYQLDNQSNVQYVGYVTDEQLIALYKNASCFVFPSFYEGFGLPPIEAMASGCPVIVSNTSSIPEVCGDAAVYCDPNSPQDIAEKIELVIRDEELQKSLRAKGLIQVKKYNWNTSANVFMSLLLQHIIKE